MLLAQPETTSRAASVSGTTRARPAFLNVLWTSEVGSVSCWPKTRAPPSSVRFAAVAQVRLLGQVPGLP